MMTTLLDTIREKLTRELDAVHVEIVDNSWQHAGHAGAASGGSHLDIRVVSPRFEGLPLMDQHRLVHQTLQHEMAHAIHALQLKTLTPATWEKLQGQTTPH